MRALDPALTVAQKLAPLIDYASGAGTPKAKVEAWNQRGGAVICAWERYYTGAETVDFHAVCMPDDGSLNRFRRNNADGHLYRQRVTSPDDESDYTSWTDTGYHCDALAAIAHDEHVIVFWIDPNDSYHIHRMESTDRGASFAAEVDMGFVSDANGKIAATFKSNEDIGLVWTIAHEIHAVRRTSGSWGTEIDSSKSLFFITGIAVKHQGDFNIVVTGQDSDAHDGVWQIVWGDDYSLAADTWGSFVSIVLREPSEDYEYHFPSIDFPDVFRLFFIERHTGTVAGYRQYWTRTGPTVDFIDCLWLEPVPFNYDLWHGVALCHNGTDVWLTAPGGVWYADITGVAVSFTTDVLEIHSNIKPGTNRSTLTIVLDNTSGKYNEFNSKGWTIAASLGFTTYSGIKYSALPYFWITGWEFVSPPWFPLRAFWPQGVIGTLKIYCEGAWEFLDRWKARKKYSWAAGDKSIFQLMNWIICRAGLEFSSWSSSDAVISYEPEFEIAAGTTGKLALKKLLGWVEDVPVLREGTIYLKYPEADDASVYTYHSTWQNQYPDGLGGVTVDHLVYRGNYGVGMWRPNMAQIDTDLIHYEAFEFDEINAFYDRLSRVTQPEYTSASEASQRAVRELRRGEIWGAYTGWCQVTVNCGQEEFDVITITDIAGGVTGILRRVLGIETTWKKVDGSYFQKLLLGAV